MTNKCPEPRWKIYSLFQSYKVKEETSRLEALLAIKNASPSDTEKVVDSSTSEKLSELEIKERLFELSIHHANPDYDYKKIFDYISFLYQHGGQDSLRYLNWGRVVREHEELVRETDSLKTIIANIYKGDRKDSLSVEHLKREMKTYSKQRDSLNSVITTQREMILKLQKLDVMMEQQRSKIQ